MIEESASDAGSFFFVVAIQQPAAPSAGDRQASMRAVFPDRRLQ
jgi:hypothetical protein